MRRIPLLIILILIIGTLPNTSGRAVPEPTQRDVFLYDYFSHVLVRFEYSLRYAIINESYSLKLANLTLQELEVIRQESLYYQERGVNTTVMKVIPPFYDFARETLLVSELLLEFHRNPSPELAAGILGSVGRMEKSLSAIEAMKLRNGTKVLTFDTRDVRKQLDKIRKMVSNVPTEGKFLLGVSDTNPILYQRISIFGSCLRNGTVTVVVEGKNLTSLLLVTPSNGLFSTSYRFEKLGTYRIYATQGGKRSNTVTVTVRKIPTMFITNDVYAALLNHTITVSGKLVDYYGNSLGGREITVGGESIVTDSTGGFSKRYFSPVEREFKVTLMFPGDETHQGTAKTVRVIFKKYPISIVLEGPKKITLGETAVFTGVLEPPLQVPLEVYINDEKHSELSAEAGNFSFKFRPQNPGEFKVYVKFAGNEKYGESVSNVAVLKVVPPEDMRPRLIAIALLGTLLLLGVALVRRKKVGKKGAKHEEREKAKPPAVVLPPEKEAVEIPEDVGEAYTLLRRMLIEKFGIGESVTPRETLRHLREWELYPSLERVTLLHEKAIYGEKRLTGDELLEFRENLKRLLEAIQG